MSKLIEIVTVNNELYRVANGIVIDAEKKDEETLKGAQAFRRQTMHDYATEISDYILFNIENHTIEELSYLDLVPYTVWKMIPTKVLRIVDMYFEKKGYHILKRGKKMTVRAISKREAMALKPDKRTLLISIQDGPMSVLPMRERTNHITRRRYVEVLFLYFDDINPDEIDGSPKFPFAFSDFDARSIINFVNRHMDNGDFDEIVVHCEAGISRSQY